MSSEVLRTVPLFALSFAATAVNRHPLTRARRELPRRPAGPAAMRGQTSAPAGHPDTGKPRDERLIASLQPRVSPEGPFGSFVLMMHLSCLRNREQTA